MMRFIIFYILLTLFNTISAKEIFTKEHISQYMKLDNPYVYSVVGQKFVYKQKENYQQGNFDTQLVFKYDKKDYPATEGEYISTGVEKPIENGMELSLAYRKSEGTQEYNNIKTGDEGEMIAGVKIPVFALANDTNKRKLDLTTARLESSKVDYKAQDNIRLLYFEILREYYKVLYYKANTNLIKELLNKTLKRDKIIKKRVDAGSLADIVLLESKQQIINRQQQLVSAENDYDVVLENLLKYLNVDKNSFLDEYEIPSIIDVKDSYEESTATVDDALQNRPDLKVYDFEKQRLAQKEKYNSILQYPDFNVGVYGVHDLEYEDDGFKVTLDMKFPIERRKYKSKNLELRNNIKHVDKQLNKRVIDIKTNLKNINRSIETLLENIENSSVEVDLLQKLEDAENKKYDIGLSNLFMLNQREMYTLQVKKKFLKYNFDYLILQERRNRVVGKYSNESFDIDFQ